MGAVVAAALLAPLVLDRPDTPHRFLGSPVMVTLGRWSYGLFVWHLAALAMVFPVIGEFPFSGHMPVVLMLTLVFGFAIAAVSYALVESPCRDALRRWERRQRTDSAGQFGHGFARARRRAMTSSRTAVRRALPASSRRRPVDELDGARAPCRTRRASPRNALTASSSRSRPSAPARAAPGRGRRPRVRQRPSRTRCPDARPAPPRSRLGRRCGRRR